MASTVSFFIFFSYTSNVCNSTIFQVATLFRRYHHLPRCILFLFHFAKQYCHTYEKSSPSPQFYDVTPYEGRGKSGGIIPKPNRDTTAISVKSPPGDAQAWQNECRVRSAERAA